MAEHLSVSEIFLFENMDKAICSENDQNIREKEAKKLKRDLEGWREVILPLHSVLLWEKNSYLGIILASTSVTFFLLWQMNPSVLSLLSFLGIIFTVVDYLVPALTLHLCHPESWTSAKERKLESICKSLAANKIFLTNCIRAFYQMRQDRPKFYYIVVIVTLLFLSWIGNAVNNLFLTYLVVTSLLLLPGIQQRGIIDNYTAYIYNMVKDKVGYTGNVKSE